MRNSLFGIALSIASMIPPALSAAEWTDAHVVVAKYYFEEIGVDRSASALRMDYARAIAHEFRAQSVVLQDKDRFAEMLPSALIDDLSVMYKNMAFNACFAPLSTTQAGQLAEFIQTRTDEAPFFSEHHFEQDLRFCVRDIVFRHLPPETYPHMMALTAYHSDVAIILATPGIARFPNRVVREDVLRSFQ